MIFRRDSIASRKDEPLRFAEWCFLFAVIVGTAVLVGTIAYYYLAM